MTDCFFFTSMIIRLSVIVLYCMLFVFIIESLLIKSQGEIEEFLKPDFEYNK